VECKEALTLISAAVDGELGGAKLKEFERHLQECENCRGEYEAEKATKNILKMKLKKVKAPPSLVDAIRRQTLGNVAPSVQEFSCMQDQARLMQQSSYEAVSSLMSSSSISERLKHLLFITSENSRMNTFFAFTLATSVLAMLVFTGFMKHRQSVFQESVFQQYETEFSKVSLNQLTGSAFESTLQVQTIPVVDYHSTVGLLKTTIHSDVVLPLVDGFFPHTAKTAILGGLPAGEIKYYKKGEPATTLSIFTMSAQDIQTSHVLPSDVFEKIASDEAAFVSSFSETGRKTVIWKWGNTVYSAVSNQSDLEMNGLFGNPKRIALK